MVLGSIFTSNKPRITSNGGGDYARVNVNENTRFVTDVQTYDKYSTEANGRWKYSIIGGASAKFFEIDSRTGKLFFKQAPEFENARDVIGQDNLYEVKVQVRDGAGYTDSQRLLVKVKDVQENS
ncbi:MAG: cadherin repeat domain-containing protein, partial [Phormidesmis sp.]